MRSPVEPAGTPGHVIRRQAPPVQNRPVVHCRGEDPLPIGREGQPRPARRVAEDSADAPTPGSTTAAWVAPSRVANATSSPSGETAVPPGRGFQATRAGPGIRELDGKISLRSCDQIETALPEDDKPVATEVKPPEGFWLGLGELSTVVEGEQAQPLGSVLVCDLQTVVGDDADLVGRDVGGDDARFTAVLLMEKLPIQDNGSRGIGPRTGEARRARPRLQLASCRCVEENPAPRAREAEQPTGKKHGVENRFPGAGPQRLAALDLPDFDSVQGSPERDDSPVGKHAHVGERLGRSVQ